MLAGEDYIEVVKSVHAIHSVADVFKCFEFIIGAYGIRNIAYLGANIPDPETSQPVFLTTYDRAWTDVYEERNYLRIDPVVRFGQRRLMPLDWNDLGEMDAQWRGLHQEAQAYDIGRQGLTFPVGGGQGIFTITSNADRRDWDVLKHIYMRDFSSLALHLHEAILKLSRHSPNRPNDPFPPAILTPQERACLQSFARGNVPKEIARQLNLSLPTVRMHLSHAQAKLNCSTKAQASVRAMSLRIIAP